MNTEFQKYIDLVGGRKEAAVRLNCSYPMVCKLVNGDHAVTGQRALEINRQFPEVSIVALIRGSQDAA